MKNFRYYAERSYSGLEGIHSPEDEAEPKLLFALASWRLLLGKEPLLPEEWSKAWSRLRAPEAASAGEALDAMVLLALEEMAGRAPAGAAKKLLKALDALPEDERDLNGILGGMGLAVLAADSAALAAWRALAVEVAYKGTANEYLFEMLCACEDKVPERPMANAVARLLQKNLRGTLDVSVAPHVLALAGIAKREHTSVAALLKNRLAELDRIAFRGGETLLTVSAPVLRPKSEGRKAVLDLELKVTGAGTLDAGIDPVQAFTFELGQTIEEVRNRLPKLKEDKRKIVKSALKSGTCRMLLKLVPEVELSAEDEAFLRRRVDLAWDLARRQLREIGCEHELEIVRGK